MVLDYARALRAVVHPRPLSWAASLQLAVRQSRRLRKAWRATRQADADSSREETMTLPLTAQEHWIDAADGTRLFCRDWLVPGATSAVQMVHGLGEHGGRYSALARLFNEAGLSVRICDHRGHGNSGGRQGSLIQSDDLLRDLKQASMTSAAPGAPRSCSATAWVAWWPRALLPAASVPFGRWPCPRLRWRWICRAGSNGC
jgi:hypothetical protein